MNRELECLSFLKLGFRIRSTWYSRRRHEKILGWDQSRIRMSIVPKIGGSYQEHMKLEEVARENFWRMLLIPNTKNFSCRLHSVLEILPLEFSRETFISGTRLCSVPYRATFSDVIFSWYQIRNFSEEVLLVLEIVLLEFSRKKFISGARLCCRSYRATYSDVIGCWYQLRNFSEKLLLVLDIFPKISVSAPLDGRYCHAISLVFKFFLIQNRMFHRITAASSWYIPAWNFLKYLRIWSTSPRGNFFNIFDACYLENWMVFLAKVSNFVCGAHEYRGGDTPNLWSYVCPWCFKLSNNFYPQIS